MTHTVEHVYAQRYCTEDARNFVGFVDFVTDSNGHNHYVARVSQGNKPFLSLAEAEVWLQTRVQNGARIVKG